MNDIGGPTRETTEAERMARRFEQFSESERREFAQALERGAKLRTVSQTDSAQCETNGSLRKADYGLEGYNAQELGLFNIEDAMKYRPWGPGEVEYGDRVREALTAAAKAILRNVPRSPLRTRALNCIIDCRMLANAAISFGGRF